MPQSQAALPCHKMPIFDIQKALIMSLNISLPAALENRVREQVASGLYGSASEVVREALRFFETYQNVQAASFAALNSDIARGLQDVELGRVSIGDMAAVKAKGRAALKQTNSKP